MKGIRVLVVDDSPLIRELLAHILNSDPNLQVVGFAGNGEEALAAIDCLAPDVVTMDIEMPGLDGYETTRRIMASRPVPIVIVSSLVQPEEVAMAFHTAQSGALAAVEKPPGPSDARHEALSRRLVQTVKLMSEVKVVRRWQVSPPVSRSAVQPTTQPTTQATTQATTQKVEKTPVLQPSLPSRIQTPQIVAIGVSTGGPPVLRTILNRLGADFPLPLLIVQHISPGFLQSMVEWLIQTTGFPTRIALQGEKPRPGYAYFAPDDYHLVVQGKSEAARLVLSPEPPECNLRPAVAPLFRSVANAYGAGAIGVLLTGMGKDGATELKLLRDTGAITIAQDKASSVVHGMPGEAIALEAARYVLPPEAIAEKLLQLAR